MSQMFALAILVTILFIGDLVSARTRAWIPSMFVCAVLFILGYWTFFPQDIVEIAGVPPAIASMLVFLLITNMGTLLSLSELKKQWKTVLIALAGVLGAAVILLTIGTLVFGLEAMIVAVPPMVGGVVSALIMSEGALAAGLTTLSVFAIVLYVIQGFIGYPLTAAVLKKEGKNFLRKFRNGEIKIEAGDTNMSIDDDAKPKLFKNLPDQYHTNFFKFARLAIVAYLAYLASVLVDPIVTIHPYVLCLLFGVLATSVGFLEPRVLEKANGFGFAMLALLLFIFDGLKNATPGMIVDIVGLLLGTLAIGLIGMYIFSWVIGRVLKVSREMAFAVTLTAMYGFPADYIITKEVIFLMTNDEKERAALMSHMIPPMLVGGFVTVTIVSVVLAGVLVGFL